MLLSAVSVLVVAQSSLEIPERLMNNPVFSVIELAAISKLVTKENSEHLYSAGVKFWDLLIEFIWVLYRYFAVTKESAGYS
jgi:hypothetical protein